jgi:hypothetical protein
LRRVTAPLLQAGFYRAAIFKQLGGFVPDYGSWADFELGQRMRAAGFRCQVELASRLQGTCEAQNKDADSAFVSARIRQQVRAASQAQSRWSSSWQLPRGLAAELLLNFPRPSLVASLLGCVAGWWAPRPPGQAVAPGGAVAKPRPAEAHTESGQSLYRHEPHAGPGRPQTRGGANATIAPQSERRAST